MGLTTYPAPFVRSVGRVSPCWFSWDGADGVLTARTGEAGTLTRGATGTATDSRGTSYTAVTGMPRWEQRDVDGDGVREALGLVLSADDMTWDAACLTVPPASCSVLCEFAEGGTRTTSGAGLVYLGNDAASGARLWITSDGTHYAATVHNGSTSVSVTLSGTFPATDVRTHALVQLEDDGTNWRVRLTISPVTTPEVETTAWSSTIARAASWPSSSRVRLNRVSSAGTQGALWARRLRIAPGLRTIDDLLATY